VQKRRVEASFGGGQISSDGGSLLLRERDRACGLSRAVARALPDGREPNRCDHSQLSLVRQRLHAVALGYADLNDHDQLRHDAGLQTAVDRVEALASSSTLCRWENEATRATAWALHEVLIEQFIASFEAPPDELVLDFDATDDAVHGEQVGRFFHGHYDGYCFLPLYVFCGDQLLVSYLRPAYRDPAHHAGAVLALLVRRLRRAWPQVRLIFRADSGFCRPRILRWCDTRDVGYVVGLARNSRLEALAEPVQAGLAAAHAVDGTKQRLCVDLQYGAHSWDRERRVILRAEHGAAGANPRYVVTNLGGDADTLYEQLYCQRGEMENRIKEQQLGLFADRTSCHHWWPNQLRLLLAGLAYTLIEGIRRIALAGTELARAQVATIRLKLLKIGTIIERNTRRIRWLLSAACPYAELFCLAAQRLRPG
jgi:hypothetical protein